MKQIVTFKVGRLNTNCYLLIEDNKCVVIDVAYHCQEVVEHINKNNLQVVAILLTHGHFDHCGGVEELKRGCNLCDVPLYVHLLDVELCQQAKQNMWRVACESCTPTHYVEQGVLQIETFIFDVLHTPGHTPGSVVYIAQNAMFSGDTLFYRSVGRTDFPGGNANQLAKSLQLISNSQKDYQIYPGHGPCTTLQSELKHNPYLS